jgi:hypothetical protein
VVGMRSYLWSDSGRWRVPRDFLLRRRAFPRFAGTRQRMIHAYFEWRGNSLFVSTSGVLINFDEEGCLEEGCDKGTIAAMALHDAKRRARRARVGDLVSVRKAQLELGRYRWNPSAGEKARITADLLPSSDARRRAIPLLRGVHAKPSPT